MKASTSHFFRYLCLAIGLSPSPAAQAHNDTNQLNHVYEHYTTQAHKSPRNLCTCLQAAQTSQKVPIICIDHLYAADFQFLQKLNQIATNAAGTPWNGELFLQSLSASGKKLYYQAEKLVTQLL